MLEENSNSINTLLQEAFAGKIVRFRAPRWIPLPGAKRKKTRTLPWFSWVISTSVCDNHIGRIQSPLDSLIAKIEQEYIPSLTEIHEPVRQIC